MTVLYILQKEFLQIFRNRAMLPIIFLMPVIQLLVLSYAATFEVKNTTVSLVDDDRSPTSHDLVESLEASGYFTVVESAPSMKDADEAMLRGEAKVILHIDSDFERSLRREGAAKIQMILNAQDGAAAGVVQAYATQAIAGFNRDIQPRFLSAGGSGLTRSSVIDVVPAHWFNPDLNYQTYMVPGILVLLVTMIGTFLSSMNVVREKEIGTIEQLNVTPLRKRDFIIGKLLPFWVLALIELAIGLVIAKVVFNIPMLGSIPLIFALAGLYLLVMLAFGLLVSTVTDTQQQAMFLAWFFIVIFILMSGLFTPIESMPTWAQRLTLLNPIAYFIEIMRRVLLKGAGIEAVRDQVIALAVYAMVTLTLAVRQYRKTST
ncbi:MAG: ABC transporter permease [Rhodothermales bacterium]|jgi:ABC-2 type transport system permease protein